MKQNKFIYKKKGFAKKASEQIKVLSQKRLSNTLTHVRFDGNNFRFGSIYLLPVFYESF